MHTRTKKKRNENRLQNILIGLMYASLIVAIAFGFIWLNSVKEYSAGKAVYRQLRAFSPSLKMKEPLESAPLPDPAANPVGTLINPAASAPSSMDFSGLKLINRDVVGWLTAEDVGINYPVVIGTDNSYYLSHLFNQEAGKLGSLFADYRNSSDFSDQNTVIYGHNMQDGSMFAGLMEYKKQSYYEQAPSMLLFTPDGDYRIELFAGILTDGTQDFGRFSFETPSEFRSYVDRLRQQSTFTTDVKIEEGDRMITLSTCTYEFEEGRYVLFGKMIPVE